MLSSLIPAALHLRSTRQDTTPISAAPALHLSPPPRCRAPAAVRSRGEAALPVSGSSMAPQLQGCYWVSFWPRLPHSAPWPCSARAQRRRVLCLPPSRRPDAGVVCVVPHAGPVQVLEPGADAEFPLKEDVGGEVGHKEEALDERERLRRLRISKANKGNTPWNKGRKHSPGDGALEARSDGEKKDEFVIIRRTSRSTVAHGRRAPFLLTLHVYIHGCVDIIVKRKLMNLGHAQSRTLYSEETRIKISEGVRRGWSLRLQKLMVQDGCFVEWRDMIADASRKGFAGGVSLQWNSYKILAEQMRLEWLENLQKKRSMPRPRGNRRAPKTPEQRRKIAEAIAAKWLDHEYRERVCSGIASYHGTSTGTRTPRKPRPAGEPGVKKQTIKTKPTHARAVELQDADGRSAIVVKRKKSAAPYKDPMTVEKLEMIITIRAERAALEIEKKEAITRARSLIAEAEKAADALDTAAETSPFAQASLIEARKLVTEARSSLEFVDGAHAEDASEDSAVLDLYNNSLDNQDQRNVTKQENKHVNGMKFSPSYVNGIGFHFDTSTFSETEKLFQRIENSMERAFRLPSASSRLKNVIGDFGLIDFKLSQSMDNDHSATESTKNCPLGTLGEEALASAKKTETSGICPPGTLDEDGTPSPSDKGKMRWIRGRLVKVDNQAEYSET
ncbi:hypothetical protein PR202_ga08134 [Eleusine coracana subsp. coracana]|uniref:Nuclease associated modular domain-containing protein n=1 Tax=Eleusine coracana subsp. coracana TaxID=191504 RepID=A0AAV5C0J1_ELECO|nr:hypothetical protein PR202_ga08134 [Eleusine coracana subsp. coracana]